MKQIIKLSFLAATVAIALMTCKDDKGKELVTGVDWDDLENVTIEVGATKTVKGKVTPGSYNANLDEFTITSSKTGVATVSGSVQGSTITVNVTGVAPGTSEITITHTATKATKSRTVTVVEAMPTGITIATQPTKTTYKIGGTFAPAGLSITATYANGSPKTITAPNDNLTYDYNFGTAGTKTVKVTYKEKSANVSVTVEALFPESITVATPPTKTDYKNAVQRNKYLEN